MKQKKVFYCSPALWTKIATEEATARGLCPSKLMAGERDHRYVTARWTAWRKLRDADYSLESMADACGFHHSSIMHGVKRLNAGQIPWANVRRSIPLITMPEFATEARG